MLFLVQFGINKHLNFFKDYKLRFTRAYLFQIAREKACDYL